MSGTKGDLIGSSRRDSAKRPKLGGDVICVLVGKESHATKFFVHTELITNHSELFKAALKRGWKEAEERLVRLPEEKPKNFENFHSFLYTGKVHSRKLNENKPSENEDLEWSRLSEAWVLGEVLLSSTYKDAVVDTILHKAVTSMKGPETVYLDVYPKSSEDSPIRRLMVDIAVHGGFDLGPKERLVCSDEQTAHALSYFQDVAISFRRVSTGRVHKATAKGQLKKEGNCHYHEHGTEKPCYKTMFG